MCESRYRRTYLEEYEELAGNDPCGPFAGEWREEVGAFVINYIAEHGRSPSNKEIIENCIPEDERERLNEAHRARSAPESTESSQ